MNADRIMRECLAATIGAAIADGTFNPLYVLQNRAQIDPKTPLRTFARVAVAERGFFGGLWQPGLLAICMRAGFGGVRIGFYPTVKRALPGDGFGTRLAAGSITAAIGMALFNPTEVVRVRMAGPEPYANTFRAFRTIALEEGLVKGLWRGASVAASRAAVYGGCQLATYESAKRGFLRSGIFMEEGPRTHLAASFVAGIASQIACQPVDTLKTVMQNDRGARIGACQTLKDLLLAGGISRLYKGLLPATVCKGPVVMLFYTLTEQFRWCLGLGYI